MKRFRWDKKYLYWGVTAFLVVVACILFYMMLSNITVIRSALDTLIGILSPFVWGLVIAYLICPLMNIMQLNIFEPIAAVLFKNASEKKIRKFARTVSVFLSVILLVMAVAALILLIAPNLILSLQDIVNNSKDFINTAYVWLENVLADYPQIEAIITDSFGDLSNGFFSIISSVLLPEINKVITNVTGGVYYVLKGVYNIFIGLIVSVYVLFNKEMFSGYAKKIIYCIFSLEAAEKVIHGVQFVDHVFLNFLSGKMLDSAIIGVICYVSCLILGMPYALLVSFIVGLTNIIPFFGPFIGAIPSALIILMVDPIKCLIFIVFVFLLQQFDGNILGPKILGSSVGVNGFWIMFSIILGAGLFGFMGMLLGVPVFVCIFTALKAIIRRKLSRSGLPEKTSFYENMSYIDPETGEAVKRETKRGQKPVKKKKAGKTRKESAGNSEAVDESVEKTEDISGV